MWFTRALYLVQVPAAIVLPAWVLVSRGVLADGIGWEFLVYLVACPILSVLMLGVAAFTMARQSVRANRAVSLLDASLLTAWYLALAFYGLYALPVLAAAILIIGLAAFWFAIGQLVSDTRRRFRRAMAEFERQAGGPQRPSEKFIGDVIVIEPNSNDQKN